MCFSFLTPTAALRAALHLTNSLSDILYVKEDRIRLSQLAHSVQASHPYRAETCCIVGE